MFKFKKNNPPILLYCTIVIFVIFFIYMLYYIHVSNNSKYSNNNSIEAFSLKKTFNSQKRKFKKFNNNHIKKYTSKISGFFKSLF
jgi:hypothetical protein